MTAAEKMEIIRLVDGSEPGVNKTLREPEKNTHRQWNSIPHEQKQLVVKLTLEHPQFSPCELVSRNGKGQKPAGTERHYSKLVTGYDAISSLKQMARLRSMP